MGGKKGLQLTIDVIVNDYFEMQQQFLEKTSSDSRI
jgi:hypothetical protein